MIFRLDEKKRCSRMKYSQWISFGLWMFLSLVHVSNAYHYRPTANSEQLSISSPKMLCLSGTASATKTHKCPETPEEVQNYPAVVMDEYGYVHVKLTNIRMKAPNLDDKPHRRTLKSDDDDNKTTTTIKDTKNDDDDDNKDMTIEEPQNYHDDQTSGKEVVGSSVTQNITNSTVVSKEPQNDHDDHTNGIELIGTTVTQNITNSSVVSREPQPQGTKMDENLDESELESEIEPEIKPEMELEIEPEPESEIEPQTEPESEPQPVPESEVEPEPEQEPEEEPEEEPEPLIAVDLKDSADGNELKFDHHLQVYLVSLEEYVHVVSQSQCCFELEMDETRPSWVELPGKGEDNVNLPKECSLNDPLDLRKHKNDKVQYDITAKFSHDYRISVPRIGKGQALSAPIPLAVSNTNNAEGPEIKLEATLRTEKFGPHMLVISNCAAEIFVNNAHEVHAIGLDALIDDIEITFVSKFGELPLSMMGIIPFYGMMTCLYFILAAVWWKRSISPKKGVWNQSFSDLGGLSNMTRNVPLFGLQRAIRTLVFMEAAFSTVAFTYYLHLNWTPVDIDVLYSGTAAALLNWGPWAMFVATAHFLTIFGCQVVTTLATDGTWLIQSHIREDTKKALYSLGGVWIIFFCLYGFLSSSIRTTLYLAIFLSWVVFLLFNVRRSLRNLRSLMIGQSSDTVMAVGGALVAKRSLYRRIYFGVAIYPIIFLLGFYWNCTSQADSWNWVGYILGDLYLFILLMHASIIWMPRPMASQEFIKYAPLEVSVAAGNDLELWVSYKSFNICHSLLIKFNLFFF